MTMTSFSKFFITWALVFTSITANAAFNCNVRDFKTNIYFSNSVDMSCDEVNFAVRALREEYKITFDVNDLATNNIFIAACNASEGATADILGVLSEKMTELGLSNHGLSAFQFYQFLKSFSYDEIRTTISNLSFISDVDNLINSLTDATFVELENAIGQGLIKAMSDRRTVDAEGHANFYELDLIASKKVIIIAHGQGTLFANTAVKDTSERQSDRSNSIAVINIANVDNQILGANTYLTATDDVIVNALRDADSSILDGNINNKPDGSEEIRSVIKHDFISDYFATGLESKAHITQQLNDMINLLPYPSSLAAEGALRANLTWGDEPDVDLHAFEPNGTHVFYSNKQGQSGVLDVDDVTQFGPENYNVACDTLENGRYTIAVNYFNGSEPEIATVTLFLASGQTVTPRKVLLEEALGSEGDTRAATTIVYEVDVQKNLDGNVTFNVLPAPDYVLEN